MKKFISMVMAAAMVVTMVPATAFAAESTLKVQGALEETVTGAASWGTTGFSGPQIQITVQDVTTEVGAPDEFDVTLKLDNAKLADLTVTSWTGAKLMDASTDTVHPLSVAVTKWVADDDEIKLTITEPTVSGSPDTYIDFAKGDIIALPVNGGLIMEKVAEGKSATVALSGELGTAEAQALATVVGKVLVAEVEDVVTVAEDEVIALHEDGLTVKAKVGNLPTRDADREDLTIKLNKGFEFVRSAFPATGTGYAVSFEDDDELKVDLSLSVITDEVVLEGIEIAATTAKAGDVAKLTVYADGFEKAVVEVAKVVDYTVVMELVDADEDVPVFYSGVNVANDGLTVTDDHKSLKVKIYETFEGAWNMNKAFTLSLPEGVYVADPAGSETGVNVVDVNDTFTTAATDAALEAEFATAYQNGDHENFEFKKYTFLNTRAVNGTTTGVHEMEFDLTLVADPGFVGDVTLKLEGAAVDTQEVVIAKFVAPWTIKAEQNDVIIDYRFTAIDTAIVVTEAEAGLWEEGLKFTFDVDEPVEDTIVFEGDATYTVNAESDLEIEDTASALEFEVTEESEEEKAEVTIDGIELYLQRYVPAGPYDLTVAVTTGETGNYDNQAIYAAEHVSPEGTDHEGCVYQIVDVADYSTTVKEAWVNVVTAGRDQSDSSFTTTVVVPVGETTIYAGDKAITLDVPAYINANGYIMVPVRAVANALGIANDCVQWNQASKTVIIMYGERLITMTAGSSVIYVGGAPLPSTSSVEIVDGRAFLGLRDLANALGVKSIDWDPVAKVGTLNPKA